MTNYSKYNLVKDDTNYKNRTFGEVKNLKLFAVELLLMFGEA